MVNAALPIDFFVQDLPCWLYTWVQPLQTYLCIQCPPCQNLALTTPTHYHLGSLCDKVEIQASDFHPYNTEKPCLVPRVGTTGTAHPAWGC